MAGGGETADGGGTAAARRTPPLYVVPQPALFHCTGGREWSAGGGAAAAVALRRFSRFPSLWFGANDTQVDSAATLAVAARHALAGIGWQQGSAASNFTHMESQVWAAARALAALPPGAAGPTPVFTYRNMQACWDAFDVQAAFMRDGANGGAFWRDPASGARCASGSAFNHTAPTCSGRTRARARFSWTARLPTRRPRRA